VNRKVLKDFRFSNGVVVPAGSIVGVPIFAIHHDSVCPNISLFEHHDEDNRKEYFTAPDQFDAFRFAGMRAEEPNGSVKHRFSTLGTTYLPFGIGRGAWYYLHMPVFANQF
jgi:cytochrome P450